MRKLYAGNSDLLKTDLLAIFIGIIIGIVAGMFFENGFIGVCTVIVTPLAIAINTHQFAKSLKKESLKS